MGICSECGKSDAIELGGGSTEFFQATNLSACPIFRPNIDIRQHPNVDIVCDLEKGIPFHSNHASQLRAVHLIQHFFYRNVPHFFDESYRVLKSGGHLFIMVSDLEYVFKCVLENGFNESHLQAIWGEGDYPSDFHHTGFTYQLVVEHMKKAGFINISSPFKRNLWEISIESDKL